MKEEYQAIIVGGGAMGVGLFYHLAHEGWTDILLIEKGELTSGSTWHAAGLVPHFIGSLNMAKVHAAAPKLYTELEEETGYVGKNPRLIGMARPNAAILSNRCFFVFVEDVEKTKDLNFDLHEELLTELHHTDKLKELVQRGEITHSIGLNAIFHLFLELQSTDSL